jgi:hypothetical protein
MDEREKRLLAALVGMVWQYIGGGDNPETVDNQCMGAGEDAMASLMEYGLMVNIDGRNGRWTEAGNEFLKSN